MITQHLKTFGQNSRPNTVIGGVASYYNTPDLLATGLGISLSRITKFKIVEDEIQCVILGTYQLSGNTTLISNVTHFYDYDSLVVGLTRNWTGFTKLVSYVLNGVRSVPEAGFSNLTQYDGVLNFPNMTQVGNAPFYGNIRAKGANFLLLNNNTGTNNFLQNAYELEYCNAPLLNKFTNAHYQNNYKLKSAVHQLVSDTVVRANVFSECRSIELIDIRRYKMTFGANFFYNIKLGCVIKCNIFSATNNSGGPDAQLVYAKNTRQSIVEFYDDNGNYVSTL